jgi:hypothetical protein
LEQGHKLTFLFSQGQNIHRFSNLNFFTDDVKNSFLSTGCDMDLDLYKLVSCGKFVNETPFLYYL